jgi:hypothetical protein
MDRVMNNVAQTVNIIIHANALGHRESVGVLEET